MMIPKRTGAMDQTTRPYAPITLKKRRSSPEFIRFGSMRFYLQIKIRGRIVGLWRRSRHVMKQVAEVADVPEAESVGSFLC